MIDCKVKSSGFLDSLSGVFKVSFILAYGVVSVGY